MRHVKIFLFLFILISSCTSNLSNLEKEFTSEFNLYLLNEFNHIIPTSETYILVLNIDCFSCNEQFTIDFAKQNTIPNLSLVICGIEGSEAIDKSILEIKRKYPNHIIDKQRRIDRYKISDSGKNVLFKFIGSQPIDYWDLGSGKFTDLNTGNIELASIIKSNH